MEKPAFAAIPQIIPKINLKGLKSKLHINRENIKNLLYTVSAFAFSSARIMGGMTPFGVSFFTLAGVSKTLIPSLIGVGAGSLLVHHSALSMCYMITSAILALVNIFLDKPLKTGVRAVVAGGLLFITKTIGDAKGGLLIYDAILNFAESLLCGVGVIAMRKSSDIISAPKKRTVLGSDEATSLVAVISVMLLSANNIPSVFGIQAGNVLSIVMILMLNMYVSSPMGAVIGIVAGAVNCIGTYNAGSIIGAYAFSALISSLFKPYGKTGVTLGFIFANAVITIILNGSTEVLINIYEILIASVILVILPERFTETAVHICGISTSSGYKDNDKVRTIYSDRLMKIAEALNILAKTPSRTSSDEIIKKEVGSLINRTGEAVCADCSLRYCCWKKKGEETKKAIMALLSAAQSHGKAYVNDIAPELKNRCIRSEGLLKGFNDSYEIYRRNLMWQRKLSDSKAVACMQMGSIAKILGDISEENHIIADTETRKKIRTCLDGKGFIPKNIIAYFKDDGNMIIDLKFDTKDYKEDMKYSIAPCLTEAIGVKIRFNEIHRDIDNIVLSYSVCERFCRATGTASVKKYGEAICGDSLTTLNLTNGTYVAAISDGMGSGKAAATESRNTIDLLKNFLQCGFDVMHTIRLINSSLMLTGEDEIFSTMDICSVNMHTGRADFVKIGGASTYIKTGNNIKKLSSASLPAGILKDIKPKHFSETLSSDTLIIMVSDGVESASVDNTWLEKRLKTIDTLNPHIIADKILELALYQSGGKARDDMTVIATRIWEENNV